MAPDPERESSRERDSEDEERSLPDEPEFPPRWREPEEPAAEREASPPRSLFGVRLEEDLGEGELVFLLEAEVLAMGGDDLKYPRMMNWK